MGQTVHVSDAKFICHRYGVPGSSARRFEEVMRMTAPQRFEQDRDLLHHLTTLTPPPLLMHNGKSSRRMLAFVPVTGHHGKLAPSFTAN